MRALTPLHSRGSAPASSLPPVSIPVASHRLPKTPNKHSKLMHQLAHPLPPFNLVTSLPPLLPSIPRDHQPKPKMNHHHPNNNNNNNNSRTANPSAPKQKSTLLAAATSLSRFRSALASALARRPPRLVGTLYGRRRGHIHLAFQSDPQTQPVTLLELPSPTHEFVKEMSASGLMRIALECERRDAHDAGARLIEEPMWRVYCNGLRRGYALRRYCGAEDWKVLRAVKAVSVGAGVLPASAADGDVMYMRAAFERVVGSKDSEAFYMMSPDGNAGPELSVYLLRV